MTLREVAHASPEYDLTVELRREVLRRPLGLDFTQAQLAAEGKDTHLALLEDGDCLGCLVLSLKDLTTLKMRQVAVRPDRQGRGLGRWLVEAAESFARDRTFLTMVLNARETAVPFYLRLGYAVEGGPFEEVGLPHRAMRKSL